MKKILISLGFLFAIPFVLTGCSTSEGGSLSGVADIFSVMPSDFDQLLYVRADDDLLDLIKKQYGESTPIHLEFQSIQDMVLRQSEKDGASLLFVDTKDDHVLDVQKLNPLGIVTTEPGYDLQLIGDIYVYGQTDMIQKLQYTGLPESNVTKQIKKLPDDSNIIFVSLPASNILGGMLSNFVNKLQGTVAGFALSDQLPRGEARLVFDDGYVPDTNDDREAITHADAPISISTYALLDLLDTNTSLIEGFLPFVLKPYLGDDAVSLMNTDDYGTIIQSLGGEIGVDMIPNPAGFGIRLTLADPSVYTIFDKIYPALDTHLTDILFTGSDAISNKQNGLLSRISGDQQQISLASVRQSSQDTQIAFLSPNSLESDLITTTYPGSTLMIADVDIDLLTAMFAPQAATLLDGTDTRTIHLEMLAIPDDNLIRITME